MIPDKVKSAAFLLIIGGAYVIGFIAIWKSYVAPWLYGMGWGKSDVPLAIGVLALVGPLIFISHIGEKFDKKAGPESRGRGAVELFPYTNLWRGGEHLGIAFGWWCVVSAALAAAAGQKLTHYLTTHVQVAQLIGTVLAFGLMCWLYLVSAVGAWRSGARYSGPKVWVVLSRIGIFGSVVLVVGALILGASGFNLFG